MNKLLAGLVGGTALLIVVAATWPAPRFVPEPEAAPVEHAMLSRAAAAQIIGETGELGPVFEGYRIGGPMPPPAVRDRVAAFARANHAELALEENGGRLEAVRFAVTYGGCCGYLEADWLAAHVGRRYVGPGCTGRDRWIDHLVKFDGNVRVRADVHINRVDVRWDRALSTAEVLARADALFGKTPGTVKASAGSDWTEPEVDHYFLALPYTFGMSPFELEFASRGIAADADRGAITRIEFTIDRHTEDLDENEKALRARWGRPRIDGDVWTWRLADRVITAELAGPSARITIQTRRAYEAIDRG